MTHKLIRQILDDSKWIVDAFDQANTGKFIEGSGNRGYILKRGIEALRESLVELNDPQFFPILKENPYG
jgi:hypothetical protein